MQYPNGIPSPEGTLSQREASGSGRDSSAAIEGDPSVVDGLIYCKNAI